MDELAAICGSPGDLAAAECLIRRHVNPYPWQPPFLIELDCSLTGPKATSISFPLLSIYKSLASELAD